MKTVCLNGYVAILRSCLVLFNIGMLMATTAGAAVIWNGPTITFTQAAGSGAVDQLTPDVWITRGSSQGLYNAITETSYTHDFSPADTAWAFGELADYASLSYTTWEQMFGGSAGGGPPSTVGKDCVVHLISDDIYLSVKMTAWGEMTGGFTYVRSTAVVPPPSFQSTTLSSNGITLTWNATAGQAYHFQYSTNLVSTNWINLGGSITATNAIMQTTDTNIITASARRFYRISMP